MAKVDKSKKVTKEAAVFKNLFSSDYVKWIEKEAEILAMSQGPWLSKEEASMSVDLAADKISKALKTGIDAEVARIVNGVREDILEVMVEENGGTMVQSKLNASLKDELKNLLGLGMSEEEITDTLVEEGFDKAEVRGLFSELDEKQPFDVNSHIDDEYAWIVDEAIELKESGMPRKKVLKYLKTYTTLPDSKLQEVLDLAGFESQDQSIMPVSAGLREEVKNLQDLGLSKEEIEQSLKDEGFSEEELNDAFGSKPAPVGNKKMAGLAEEVKNLQDLGLSKEEITDTLVEEGFSQEELDHAFGGEAVPAKGQMAIGRNEKDVALSSHSGVLTVECRECGWITDLVWLNDTNPEVCPECGGGLIGAYTGEEYPPITGRETRVTMPSTKEKKLRLYHNKKSKPWLVKETRMNSKNRKVSDLRRDINWLDRSEIQELLEGAGFAVYDTESDEDLKEALFEAVESGDITLDASKIKLSKLEKDAALNLKPLRRALNFLEKKAESEIDGVTGDDKGNIIIEFERSGLGRTPFPRKLNTNVDEFVYEQSLMGATDEELGESENFGYYALLTFDPPVIVHQGGPNGEWAFAAAILNEDSQGFIDVATYETTEEAKDQWALIESDYAAFMGDVESEMGEEEDLD